MLRAAHSGPAYRSVLPATLRGRARLPLGAAGTTTIESKTNFLRAVTDGHVDAISRPLHRGRTIIVVETDLVAATGTLVGRVTQSQLVLGRARPS